jgi:hypothetical protein
MPRFLRGIVLAGALLLAGCGLGKNVDPAAVEQTEVTKAQLAAMVLPAEELGPEVAKLEVDDDVGVVDNRQAADDSLDPDDTGKSLRGEGRLLGYKLSYSHPKLASANTKGVLGLGSLVEVLEGPVDAAQYLHARLNDYERFKNAVPGFKLSGYSTFEALVGDEAGGEQVKLTVRGVLTGYLTDVYFRRGRIVGSVEIVRTDREDAQEEALELATELDSRIQAVLSGELKVEPAKTPTKANEVSASELAKLPSRTLKGEDVGPGVVAVAEGRLQDDDYEGYYREFGDVLVGGSHLIKLRAVTELYRSKKAAELAHRIRTEEVGRRIFAQAVVERFGDETGVRPTNVTTRPLANPGPGLSGMVVSFELVGAKFRMVAVFMRSGQLIQSVIGICRANQFDPRDLAPVARRAQSHLA